MIDTGARTAMWGGAGTAWVFLLANASAVAALVSALIAVLGFIVHLVMVVRRDKRLESEHKLRMEALLAGQTAFALRCAEDSPGNSRG